MVDDLLDRLGRRPPSLVDMLTEDALGVGLRSLDALPDLVAHTRRRVAVTITGRLTRQYEAPHVEVDDQV